MIRADRENLAEAAANLLEMRAEMENFSKSDAKDLAKEIKGIANFFEKHPERWIKGGKRSVGEAEWNDEGDRVFTPRAVIGYCSIGLRNNLDEIKIVDPTFKTFASDEVFDRAADFIVGLNDGMSFVPSVVIGLRTAAEALTLSTRKGVTFEQAVTMAFAKNARLLQVQNQRFRKKIAAERAAREARYAMAAA